jgi:hypothetical protein
VTPLDCICWQRGYCAHDAGDPLACRFCVALGAEQLCPCEDHNEVEHLRLADPMTWDNRPVT